MKIMALDVGRSRIGVAFSDPDQTLAFPHAAIDRASEPEDIAAVLDLAQESDVQDIVVGLPLSLSGEAGPQAREVTRFARSLSARAEVPVTTLDERYSTVQAERLMRQAGQQPSRNRPDVDAMAAAIILQSYLDSRRTAPQG